MMYNMWYLWCFCMMCDIYGKSICVLYDVSVVFVVYGMSMCCVMCMVCGSVCVCLQNLCPFLVEQVKRVDRVRPICICVLKVTTGGSWWWWLKRYEF